MNNQYKQVLADLLTEVKLAEKKLMRAQEQLPVGESRIKQALVAGKRELAKKYALQYEESKLQVKRAEQHLAQCKKQYEVGKQKAASAPSEAALRRMIATTNAMNNMAGSLEQVSGADDMLRKLEEEAAVSEARLDIAVDEARANNPEIDMPVSVEPELPPATSPEDILKEFE